MYSLLPSAAQIQGSEGIACFHFNTKGKSTQHASVTVTTDLGVQGPSITMRINSGITVPLKGPGAIG